LIQTPFFRRKLSLPKIAETLFPTQFQIGQTAAMQNRGSVLERRAKMIQDFLARYQLSPGANAVQ
jgi:hypothetical protein